jgi:hypothetical protein
MAIQKSIEEREELDKEIRLMERACLVINRIQPEREAYVQHTGGGIYCIELKAFDQPKGHYWYFGTADENWAGQLCTPEGDSLEILAYTSISSDCKEPLKIGEAILHALANNVTNTHRP